MTEPDCHNRADTTCRVTARKLRRLTIAVACLAVFVAAHALALALSSGTMLMVLTAALVVLVAVAGTLAVVNAGPYD